MPVGVVVLAAAVGWLFNGWVWWQWRTLRQEVADISARLTSLDHDLRG
jgi:hypothetical protein